MRTAADFYRLREEQLLELEGFGELSARNLLAAIEASKRAAVRARAVRARDRGGGRGDGAQPRPALPRRSTRCSPRRRGDRSRLPGWARRWPRSIRCAARRRAHARADRGPARRSGLRFDEEGPPPSEGPLAGKTLVLTGTLPDWSREQATERIMAAGGRVTGSVSEEDRLRRRRREPGLEAREGRAPRRARCSTRRACASCSISRRRSR